MSGTIDRPLGFKVSPLIGMVAPFVINQSSQRASAHKLDKDGVAKLLRDEQSTVLSQGGPAAAVAIRVMGAPPSGLSGASKEVVALGKALAESRKNAAPTSILNLVCETDLGADEYKKLPQDDPGLVNVARRALQAVAHEEPHRRGQLWADAR